MSVQKIKRWFGSIVFNQAVKRNAERFPDDFAFQLTHDEWKNLKSQFVTSNLPIRGGRRYLPLVFTEHGALMAANVLRSKRAIGISIQVVRAFIRLREFLGVQKEFTRELNELKSFMLKHSHSNDREFQRVWKAMEKLSAPLPQKEQRRIGFDLG